jgi:hypothetical protein
MDKVFVKLKNTETGEVSNFWPVDAREIMASSPEMYEIADAEPLPGIFETPVTEKIDVASVSIPEREVTSVAEPEAPKPNTRRK